MPNYHYYIIIRITAYVIMKPDTGYHITMNALVRMYLEKIYTYRLRRKHILKVNSNKYIAS